MNQVATAIISAISTYAIRVLVSMTSEAAGWRTVPRRRREKAGDPALNGGSSAEPPGVSREIHTSHQVAVRPIVPEERLAINYGS